MRSSSRAFEAVLADADLMAEIQSRAKASLTSRREVLDANEISLPSAQFSAIIEGRPHDDESTQRFAEAIVLVDGRPSLLIRNDTFTEPDLDYWKSRLTPYRSVLNETIKAVGRIELSSHTTYDWVGTAWVIGDRLVATNRHVASVFAQRKGLGFVFRQNEFGQTISARVDFKEEYQSGDSKEIAVERILYVAPDSPGQPDIAILQLADDGAVSAAIQLAASSATRNAVAAIGYPAYDSRNGDAAMRKIFRDIYDVKRLAPGYLTPSSDPATIGHNCSTLGGNSGSVIVDVPTGRAVGLHFGGRFKIGNYAVKVETIRAILGQLPASAAFSLPTPADVEAPTVASLAGREGYKADFLGSNKRVRLPRLSEDQEADATPVPGRDDFVLAYTHFSVVMCKSRKLCYFTAVNIDGNQSINLRRTGSWFLDPRIPADDQSGNELYAGNNLDRGHMVRRLDPVWGTQAVAKQANNDTFMYTNSCPQHANLNQKTWNDLEDYILNNADQRNLKVSVFTGPVFRDSDIVYRNTRIPQDFWKVVVMVKTDGKLSATAYLLSQRDMLGDIEAPGFAFGAFRTYQLPIQTVETLTGLSFGNLSTFDPLGRDESTSRGHEIRGEGDIVV